MLKNVIAFSLKSPGLVLASALLILGITMWKIPGMAVDVFPELNAPTVVIMTEAPGLAADEVERYVSFPLESAVNGLSGVTRVRSSSALSLSIVWVEFDWDEDIFRARQMVNERLSSARENLPENVHSEIAPVSSVTGEVMLVSLSSPNGNVSPLELRSFAEFDLRNRLLAVSGITQVVALGGELPEYQINVDPSRLRLYGLTANEVAEAARKSHNVASAGYLANVEGQELPLRQTGRVRSIDDIRQTVVQFHEGAAIKIGDVADVLIAGAPKRGTGSEAGVPAVIVSIQKAPGANTLSLIKAIDGVLDQIEPAMPEGMVLNRQIFRQSDFISLSVNNVIKVSRDAAIFVAIVLILFLMNVRTTLITLTALPLSLAVAMLVLSSLGLSVNVMTLGGLAVAIGELVDDAIIDVENVWRRLQENSLLPPEQRLAHTTVVFNASNEIRSSVVYATLIIIIVFVPLLFLQGLEGRFFRPLGIAYIVSILASLAIALTVTPAMCKLLLRGKLGKGHHDSDGRFVRLLKRLYGPALKAALRLRYLVLAGALVATGIALLLGRTYGTSFLPEFNEGTFTVFLMAPPGTSLTESDRLARGVEKKIAKMNGVRSVVRRTGRAEKDQHAEPVSSSELEVSVLPGHSREEIRKQLSAIIEDVPGITTNIGQPIEHRLSHILSGTPAAIAINIYGDNLDLLRKAAKDVGAAVEGIQGARDVVANREILIDSIPVDYRPGDLARFGLTPQEAASQLELAYSGAKVAEINEGTRRLDMTVRLDPAQRESVQNLRDFILRTAGGSFVKLSEVATIGKERTSNLITRESGRRKAVVSCNVAAGENLGDLIAAVQNKVDPIIKKYKLEVHYGGQFEAQQSASRTILVMGAGAIVAIFLLLKMALHSSRAALLVMINLPLSLIGGIFAIFLSESPGLVQNFLALFGVGESYVAPVISIASMVGFVTLFGIAVRNGILLVNQYQHLVAEENLSIRDAVIQGSMERLVPILMTALTAILGLIPLAIASGEPGSELLAPLAVVVLGGLVSSTILNLFVIPAGYLAVFSRRQKSNLTHESGQNV